MKGNILDSWLGHVKWGEFISWSGLAAAIFYLVATRYLKLSDAEAALLAGGAFGTGALNYIRNPKALDWIEPKRASEGNGREEGPPRALPAGPNGIDSLARSADLIAREMGSARSADLPEARRHDAPAEKPFAGPTPSGYRELTVEELVRLREAPRPVVPVAPPEPDGPIDGPAPDFS